MVLTCDLVMRWTSLDLSPDLTDRTGLHVETGVLAVHLHLEEVTAFSYLEKSTLTMLMLLTNQKTCSVDVIVHERFTCDELWMAAGHRSLHWTSFCLWIIHLWYSLLFVLLFYSKQKQFSTYRWCWLFYISTLFLHHLWLKGCFADSSSYVRI